MKLLSTLCLTLFVILVTPQASYAQDEGGMVNKILEYLQKQDAATLCSKASIFKAKVTLRSFEGRLCAIKPWAAFTAVTCLDPSVGEAKINDFLGSGCAEKIRGIFPTADGKIDTAAAQQYLIEVMNNPVGELVKKGICMAKSGPLASIPTLQYLQANYCN